MLMLLLHVAGVQAALCIVHAVAQACCADVAAVASWKHVLACRSQGLVLQMLLALGGVLLHHRFPACALGLRTPTCTRFAAMRV